MSSEEPFNYIEHKIKEAAQNHEIVFEESSWKKMEALLDNEPRRKPFIWWWFLLPLAIAGGVGVWLVVNPNNSTLKNNETTTAMIIPVKKTSTTSVTTTPNTALNIDNKNPENNYTATNKPNNKSTNVFKFSQKTNTFVSSKAVALFNIKTAVADEENTLPDKNIFTEKGKTNFTINNGNATENDTTLHKTNIAKTDSAIKNLKEAVAEKTITDSSNRVSKKQKEIKKKQSTLSKLYVIGSLGADVSTTKLLAFKKSPATLKYGLGAGFNINKKLSVQTGFYVNKKKYIANEGDYNFKTGSYYNTVKVIMVDAACIVYEIPVSVRYNFIQKKLLNIYAGVGLSSYIMKKEDYNVFFVRNYMQVSRVWNYTGNQHFLSTLIISAGAEKKLTNKIAFQIEPSVSIPLKGVGEGTVKLFSTSLQVGLKYAPFK